MAMHLSVSLTGSLAIYGAILSTVTGIIQIINHRKDRANVRINVRKNMLPTFPDRRYGGKQLVIITAINAGRRPVRIEGFAAQLLNDPITHWYLPDVRPPLPCDLTEGKTVSAFLIQERVNFDLLSHWYVWDSVGRHYRLNVAPWHKRMLSRIRNRFRRANPPLAADRSVYDPEEEG